jgi:molybdate transport system substrate-binding protein
MVKQRSIRILSAGAPKQGVRLCAQAHETRTGQAFEIEFATAPVICERVYGGATADLIVAPVAALIEFIDAGHIVEGSWKQLGDIEAGVAAPIGTPKPDVSSIDTLRDALLAADRIIYNRASSGQYIDTMIERLGIARQVSGKTVRTNNGAQTMQRLADDTSERAIGFGQITEIKLRQDLGIQLVGPLPAEIGKRTPYAVGIHHLSSQFAAARSLLEYYGSGEAREILINAGLS